ncbi:MAG: hypothetical protein JSS69_04890 [Acidobacteria bacterium]|nr:hypothetical protein [Acidobacteriota bacterium]MBS1865235.1 hypothetical protein [Acidobacteriota bacterium]
MPPDMRILVTFAVEAEFAPWRKIRKFERGSSKFEFSSSTGETPYQINVLLTGIGEVSVNAALAKTEFLTVKKPDVLVSSGFAGGLKPELTACQIIAPVKTRTLKNHANVDSEPPLRDEAVHLGALPIENLITVDRLVKTAEEKSRLAFFGEAVDMESAIVMDRFAQAGVPSIAIRVVSDVSGEDLPLDFDRCLTPQGAVKPLNLLNQIVRGPQRLPDIIRFGRQSFSAGQKLAEFIEKFVAAVPAILERSVNA